MALGLTRHRPSPAHSTHWRATTSVRSSCKRSRQGGLRCSTTLDASCARRSAQRSTLLSRQPKRRVPELCATFDPANVRVVPAQVVSRDVAQAVVAQQCEFAGLRSDYFELQGSKHLWKTFAVTFVGEARLAARRATMLLAPMKDSDSTWRHPAAKTLVGETVHVWLDPDKNGKQLGGARKEPRYEWDMLSPWQRSACRTLQSRRSWRTAAGREARFWHGAPSMWVALRRRKGSTRLGGMPGRRLRALGLLGRIAKDVDVVVVCEARGNAP